MFFLKKSKFDVAVGWCGLLRFIKRRLTQVCQPSWFSLAVGQGLVQLR